MVATVIADIVGSRELADRAVAQRALEESLALVAEVAPAADAALLPTVGDELQGVYPDLVSASAATMLLQLMLPAEIELRFGIGLGAIEDIPSVRGVLSEGEAWWAARQAIEEVEALARRAAPTARTRVAAPASAPAEVRQLVRIANDGFLARDRAVAQLSPRARRIVYRRWLGETQTEIAAAEGVGQSAVSQAIATADAGPLIEGLRILTRQND
ncbi:SatD family protein [Microbacterium aoyamense]|uniref:SatD family protein n=1 Tax=Microbacterium aoyamense TaxID=344166 RepID=A0ABP5B8P0_9MICO|nr:SatD family protein [Microbacterium aoyamense]